MNINERIRHLRKKELNVTQAEFAKAINISRSNLGNIEVGNVAVTERVEQDICKSYNINREWLRTGNGTMYAQPEANTKSVIEQALDLLDKQYNMDKYEKAMMKSYFEMTPAARQGFQTFLKEIAPALAAEADEKKVAESAAEYNARRIPDKEDFIRQVELETATRGKLSVSPLDDGRNVV